MSNRKNLNVSKYGLKRYIPAGKKRIIRKEAGYGCVLCGRSIIQYHHIDPEFVDAKEHDPSKMTLLCGYCHDKAKDGIGISRERIWKAKNKPQCKQSGFTKDLLHIETSNLEIKLGSTTYSDNNVIISAFKKPLLWFESAFHEDEPYTLSCIFNDDTGRATAYINRNEFIGIVGNNDIVCLKRSITVRHDKHKILQLERVSDEPLQIKYYKTKLNDKVILITENKGIQTPKTGNQFYGQGTLAGFGYNSVDSKAIVNLFNLDFQYPLTSLYPFTSLEFAVKTEIYGTPIKSSSGYVAGWLLNENSICSLRLNQYKVIQLIIDKSYNCVGYVDKNKAYLPNHEFVCYWNGEYLYYPSNQYETGEPIFVPPIGYTKIVNVSKHGYNLSYRFLDDLVHIPQYILEKQKSRYIEQEKQRIRKEILDATMEFQKLIEEEPKSESRSRS